MPASYSWNSAFNVPPAPSGLTVTPDPDIAALDLAVTASTDPYHETYVWEAQSPDGPDWIEIGRSVDPTFSWLLAPFNLSVGIRARDNIGAPTLSDAAESVGTLASDLWWMTHTDGDPDFIRQLRYVDLGAAVDIPLNQTILDPLPGPNDDPLAPTLPIVFTGTWQGERVTLAMTLLPDDNDLLVALKRAARLTPGKVAIKSPGGEVYRVQLGSMRTTVLSGLNDRRVEVTAVRIA